jgi:hypothetical protein
MKDLRVLMSDPLEVEDEEDDEGEENHVES